MNKERITHEAMCISKEEKEVINDIRSLEFGKVSVSIQDGFIVNREITKTIRNNKNGNNF